MFDKILTGLFFSVCGYIVAKLYYTLMETEPMAALVLTTGIVGALVYENKKLQTEGKR